MSVNPVEVDHQALDLEAERLLQQAPQLEPSAPPAADAAPLEAPSSAPSSAGWSDVTPGIIAAVDILVIPQWGVTDKEKQALTAALTDVLEAAFPGGLDDERYAPYVRFALVSFGVVMAHRDPDKGFPPLGPKREAPPSPAPSSSNGGYRA